MGLKQTLPHSFSQMFQRIDSRIGASKPAVRPYSKGQKNDFREAEAIAEAVQRPTMKFVATSISGSRAVYCRRLMKAMSAVRNDGELDCAPSSYA